MASTKKKSDDKRRAVVPSASAHSDKNTAPVVETCNMRQFVKEHPLLATLLNENGILFECDAEAPAPSKDYGQIQINLDKIIIRWWKITIRNVDGAMYPGEIKDSFEDFYYDETAQREIWRIFGQKTLDYCINVVRGKYDWLTRLPPNVQIRILSYVNLDDIPQISLVSKSLRSLCRNNDLWQIFYTKSYGKHALQNRDLIHLAERRGWRHVFFTNRLKLQMQLRREAQLHSHHPEDPSDIVKARERRSQLQPSPPSTPRQQEHFSKSSVRRHSFATRKESPRSSFRGSPLPDRIGTPRKDQSFIDEDDEARRLPSPSSSLRSNAGSMSSRASTRTPLGSSNHD